MIRSAVSLLLAGSGRIITSSRAGCMRDGVMHGTVRHVISIVMLITTIGGYRMPTKKKHEFAWPSN